MAGTPNGNLSSPQDAKARLLELGQRDGSSASGLAHPFLCIGASLLAGAAVGHQARRARGRDGAASSLGSLVSRMATALAPMLVDQIVRAVTARASSHKANDTANDARCQDAQTTHL